MAAEHTHDTDDAVERALDVYREMRETEREQMFRDLAGVVAAFGRTRDVDPLVRFADDVAMTIRLRLVPGYQDSLHEAQTRLWDSAKGVDVDEVLKQP